MGEIVGAALVSHVPPIVMPVEVRRALNDGLDTTLVDGLHRLRAECLDRVRPDTIVVFDTHWFTTFEHVVSGHQRRHGRFTSDELPRGMAQMPYDYQGDPELAAALAALADARDDTWIHATNDDCVAVHYPTINLMPFLQRDERWMSVGICQTAEPSDFLLFGELLAEAVRSLDRRVVLLASGGLSHRFWPLRELRSHEAAGLEHISSPGARASDERLIARLEAGDHRAVLASYDELRSYSPEGFFAHYLMLVGALGAASCSATATRYSEYESAAGTGQIHLWFEPSEGGWTA
jgi:3,4-dihydroxyphenylacetate 2,3-dioxygenase